MTTSLPPPHVSFQARVPAQSNTNGHQQHKPSGTPHSPPIQCTRPGRGPLPHRRHLRPVLPLLLRLNLALHQQNPLLFSRHLRPGPYKPAHNRTFSHVLFRGGGR